MTEPPVGPLPFTLEMLLGAAVKPPEPLTACPAGHLLVSGRTCWSPLRFSADLRAIWCQPITDCTEARHTQTD